MPDLAIGATIALLGVLVAQLEILGVTDRGGHRIVGVTHRGGQVSCCNIISHRSWGSGLLL